MNDQVSPDCAAFGSDFVAVWESTADPPGAYAQRFDNQTQRKGSEFRVSGTGLWGHQPHVTAINGGFVLAHHSSSGGTMQVFAQRFDETGIPVGGETVVNTYAAGLQCCPHVARLPTGFVVVWLSDAQDGSGYGVYAQVFDDFGSKAGPELRVNAYALGDQEARGIATLDSGFVVVWKSFNQTGNDFDVYARIFDNGGTPMSGELLVNSFMPGAQSNPSVASIDGGFVVVWRSYDQDGDLWGVFGQVFSSTGVKTGTEFQVNTYVTGNQGVHLHVAGVEGNFVAVWQGYGETSTNVDVIGQYFGSTGEKIGEEFTINVHTPGSQITPRVAALGDGFVVVWRSDGGQDGDGSGVFGRQFIPQTPVPTPLPTVEPSRSPTRLPTQAPSTAPTHVPTSSPSSPATFAPSPWPSHHTLPSDRASPPLDHTSTHSTFLGRDGTTRVEDTMTRAEDLVDSNEGSAAIIAVVVAALVVSFGGAATYLLWRKRRGTEVDLQRDMQRPPLEDYDKIPTWNAEQGSLVPRQPTSPTDGSAPLYGGLQLVGNNQGIAPTYDEPGPFWKLPQDS